MNLTAPALSGLTCNPELLKNDKHILPIIRCVVKPLYHFSKGTMLDLSIQSQDVTRLCREARNLFVSVVSTVRPDYPDNLIKTTQQD